MNPMAEMYLERAENEFAAAGMLMEVSRNQTLQKEQFRIEKNFTFYSAVISHSYYCIFYSAKAILLSEGIKTDSPDIHKKTFEAFEAFFVKTGKLDVQLLMIYKKMMLRAEELLGIYSLEKKKRGEYTYQKLPQANMEPAGESLKNASLFFKAINGILRKL
ncbi:hypothetical protein L6303_04660 [archaeon]|nr:HEPN domain-containing protein [Nanoarchaeota archaeon]MBU4300567.1 HEPN domain-containing protein [Nanoarchaeota archaeon]MBU4451478.1 HEPN domain-containing protein [Nanoarchaeota archaeon]MCG2724010.1 hypothetical protein [archaeon]